MKPIERQEKEWWKHSNTKHNKWIKEWNNPPKAVPNNTRFLQGKRTARNYLLCRLEVHKECNEKESLKNKILKNDWKEVKKKYITKQKNIISFLEMNIGEGFFFFCLWWNNVTLVKVVATTKLVIVGCIKYPNGF